MKTALHQMDKKAGIIMLMGKSVRGFKADEEESSEEENVSERSIQFNHMDNGKGKGSNKGKTIME